MQACAPAVSDDFTGSQLGLQWQWHANPQGDWATLATRPGWLRMTAARQPVGFRNLWDAPYLLLQKFPAREFVASCSLDGRGLQVGETAGLLVMGQDYAYLGLHRSSDGLTIVRRTCRNAESGSGETTDAVVSAAAELLECRAEVAADAQCRFSYRVAKGEWQPLGPVFPAREGKWIGAKVGLFCQGTAGPVGHVDVDQFLIERMCSESAPAQVRN